MAQLHRKQVDEALDRLAELAKLEFDWDSYGALPPARVAVNAAGALVRTVVERWGEVVAERAVPYWIAPIADGGIQLEWRGPAADLELNIGPDAVMSYLLIERDADGRRFTEGCDLPREQVLSLICRIIGA